MTDLVVPVVNDPYESMLSESEIFNNDFMKNTMSPSSNNIIRGRSFKDFSLDL